MTKLSDIFQAPFYAVSAKKEILTYQRREICCKHCRACYSGMADLAGLITSGPTISHSGDINQGSYSSIHLTFRCKCGADVAVIAPLAESDAEAFFAALQGR